MLVKHLCGHEVDAPANNAWLIRKTLCYKCEQIRNKLFKEEKERFRKALAGTIEAK